MPTSLSESRTTGNTPAEHVADHNTVHAFTNDLARPPALIVAASDAPVPVKACADYVCDGTADEVQINAAILRAAPIYSATGDTYGRSDTVPSTGTEMWGRVELSGGVFTTAQPILMYSGVKLQGQGANTLIKPVTTGFTDAGYGATNESALIKNATTNEHHVEICDMYLYGEFAAGDECRHGIYLDNSQTTTGNLREHPNTDPDPEQRIHNLFIRGFKGGTNARYGIWIRGNNGSGTYVNRAAKIHACAIREVKTAGIYLQSAPDGHVSDCHVGTSDEVGFYINGANQKLTNCKAFYCDTYGYRIASGKGLLAGCEVQDSLVGFFFDATPVVATALVADTCKNDGIIVSANGTIINGFDIFNRSGGRATYDPAARGLTFDAAGYKDCSIVGVVDGANPSYSGAIITTPISGTLPTAANRNFIRVTSGVGTSIAASVG